MSLYDNFFVGMVEYRIRFRNGIHQIVDTTTQEVVYEGWYERCLAVRDQMITDYQVANL